jgi:Protein of unknown function (DUF4231)
VATIPTQPSPTQTSKSDPALSYALRQMAWYMRAGRRARFFHQAGEITVLLTTAATVVVAALHASAIVTATIAAVTLFLTGFRQVFGPNENWVRASRTKVAIEHVIVRYQLVPQEERDAAAQRELMEQVIAICAEETSQWAAQQRKRAAGEVPQDHAAAISLDKS